MKFSEKLNEYMENLDCSAKEICDSSGLSQATLSRYRSGERTPDIGTDSFEKLCVAIAAIAQYRLATDITEFPPHFSVVKIYARLTLSVCVLISTRLSRL